MGGWILGYEGLKEEKEKEATRDQYPTGGDTLHTAPERMVAHATIVIDCD